MCLLYLAYDTLSHIKYHNMVYLEKRFTIQEMQISGMETVC